MVGPLRNLVTAPSRRDYVATTPAGLPFAVDVARVRALSADDRKLIEDFIVLVLNRAAARNLTDVKSKTKTRINLDEATQPRGRNKRRAA